MVPIDACKVDDARVTFCTGSETYIRKIEHISIGKKKKKKI